MIIDIESIRSIRSDTELLDYIGRVSAELIEKNYPYVPRVVEQIKRINEQMGGNGIVHIELKIYQGKVTEAVFHEVTKLKF
jgi:hypothetical protein